MDFLESLKNVGRTRQEWSEDQRDEKADETQPIELFSHANNVQAHANVVFDIHDVKSIIDLGAWTFQAHFFNEKRLPYFDHTIRTKLFEAYGDHVRQELFDYVTVCTHVTQEQSNSSIVSILLSDRPKELAIWLNVEVERQISQGKQTDTTELIRKWEVPSERKTIPFVACRYGAAKCVEFLFFRYLAVFDDWDVISEMISAALYANDLDVLEVVLSHIRRDYVIKVRVSRQHALTDRSRDELNICEQTFLNFFRTNENRENVPPEEWQETTPENYEEKKSILFSTWNHPFKNSSEPLALLTEYAQKCANNPFVAVDESEIAQLDQAFADVWKTLSEAIQDVCTKNHSRARLEKFCSARIFREYKAANEIYGSVWSKLVAHYTPFTWNAWLTGLQEQIHQISVPAGIASQAQPIVHPLLSYPLICEVQVALQQFLCYIASKCGGFPYIPAPKGFQRIIEKCVQKSIIERLIGREPAPADHWDYCRGTINFETIYGLTEGFRQVRVISEESSVFTLQEANVRFTWESIENYDPDGVHRRMKAGKEKAKDWQDLAIYGKFNHTGDADFPLNQQLTVEIQFSLMPFTLARKGLGGHELYAQYRLAKTMLDLVGKDEQAVLDVAKEVKVLRV